MIQGLTRAIKESWILKGFLGILMISFAIWGVGDSINPAVDPNVAIKVDQVEVRTEELQRRFTAEVNQLRQAIGTDFTAKDAADLGIMDNIVAQLSERATLDMAARTMGLTIPDEALRRTVLEQDAFKDETGNFNRTLLNQVLSSNGVTEQGYIDLLRSDVSRQIMLQPIAANARAPKAMIDAIFTYRAEQRSAELLYVADESVQLGDEPTEEALSQVYDENLSAFTAPEYREVEVIVISTTDLVPLDSITQEEIQLFYDENIDRYRTKPTRTVRQLVFATALDATTAYNQIKDGDTLMELGERIKVGAPIDLGELKANDNLGFDLSAVFEQNELGISAPIQTGFGWHLFEVTALTSGSISAIPVVREDIIDFIVTDRSFDEMYEATIYLEDQLSAGVPMTEIAETPGYTRIYFKTLDREGRDATGAPLTFPIDQERIIRSSFSTDVGSESPLIESDDYAYILRVNAVIEPAPKPYKRVELDVRVLWEEQARASATLATAKALLNDIGASTDLPALANNNDAIEFAKLGPITRFGDSLLVGSIIPARLVSPALMEILFQMKIGDAVEARVGNGHVIAKLKEILPPNGPELAQVRDQVTGAVGSALANDLVTAFTRTVSEEFNVVLNREAIDQLIPQ
ncbi:MAG: SurA N-terminal domain-containing protein [Rhodospirillaceae bacterium]|nr:SurA N-terminal domain-containing protein [Rhodospirillaceae bacterium]